MSNPEIPFRLNGTPKEYPVKPLQVVFDPAPIYMVQFCRGVTYADPTTHNPIGVCGDIYLHQDGARVVLRESIGGMIPLMTLPTGSTIILHLPGGMRGSHMAIDAARLMAEEYKMSVTRLIDELRREGFTVLLYIGSRHDFADKASGMRAWVDWVQMAKKLRCGLIVDSAATNLAKPFVMDLAAGFMTLRQADLPCGVEGMWHPDVKKALGDLITCHFVEGRTVERSFMEPKHPGWKDIAPPDPTKVWMWDMSGRLSTPDAAPWLSANPLGTVAIVNPEHNASGIQAENWMLGGPGPRARLIVTRQDSAARALLGCSEQPRASRTAGAQP